MAHLYSCDKHPGALASSLHMCAGLYGTFVIEQRHFGKQTLGLWLTGLLQHTVKSKHAPSPRTLKQHHCWPH